MARSFNGSTDKINFGMGIFEPTDVLTICAWVNMTSLTPSYCALISRNDSTHFQQILVKSSGAFAYYISAASGVCGKDPGLGTISTGSWHHVAFSYDATNGMKAYLDGVDDGTVANKGAMTVQSPAFLPLTIGVDLINAGTNLGGNVADAALWNAELTAGEITALSKGIRPYNIRSASLFAYWPLDGISSPEPDLSGFGNNGTLTGTAIASGPPLAMFTPRWPLNTDVAAAAPSFIPAWATSNIPVIGTGVY